MNPYDNEEDIRPKDYGKSYSSSNPIGYFGNRGAVPDELIDIVRPDRPGLSNVSPAAVNREEDNQPSANVQGNGLTRPIGSYASPYGVPPEVRNQMNAMRSISGQYPWASPDDPAVQPKAQTQEQAQEIDPWGGYDENAVSEAPDNSRSQENGIGF